MSYRWLLLLLIPSQLFAQITNVQSKLDSKKSNGWESDLAFRLAYKNGNVNLLDLGADGNIHYVYNSFSQHLTANARYVEKNEEIYIKKSF